MPLESIQPQESPVADTGRAHASAYTRIRQHSLSSIDYKLLAANALQAIEHSHQYATYVPYTEPVSTLQCAVSNPIAFEQFTLISMLACLDSLLYYLSFLPINILMSLMQLSRSMIAGRSASPYENKSVHIVLQGVIMAVVLCMISLLQDYGIAGTYIDTYSQIIGITWTRLYVLYNLFAIAELILERVGIRLNGHLHYAVLHSTARTTTTILSILYVLLHCYVLQLQISTLHTAFDQSNELLSLLSATKVMNCYRLH